MLQTIFDFLTNPLWNMPEHQQQAIGARHLWWLCRKHDDPEMNKWLARTAIKMQTYFRGIQ